MKFDSIDLRKLFLHHLNLSGDEKHERKFQSIGLDVNYYFEEVNNTLYIHFEGSNSTIDWIRNFLFKKVPYKNMEEKFKVHRGFLEAWREVKDIIFDKITEAAETTRFKYNEICVIGYSHGGGLAILCHEFINYYRPDLKDNLISLCYESPRVISKISDELKERWSNCYLIKNANDIVTRVPPKLFGYQDVGNTIKIGNKKNIERYKLWPKCILAHTPYEVNKSLKKYEKDEFLIKRY